MNFEVYSRAKVEYIAPTQPYIVISITTPKLPVAKIPDSEFCRGILRLSFDDTGDYGQPLRGDILFTDSRGTISRTNLP